MSNTLKQLQTTVRKLRKQLRKEARKIDNLRRVRAKINSLSAKLRNLNNFDGMDGSNYAEKLQEWFGKEKSAGRLVDLKFFPGIGAGQNGSVEKFAQAAYETLTGACAAEPLDTSDL